MSRREVKSKSAKTRKPWGGRFQEGTDARVEAFTESVSFDYRLAPYDILASVAHAEMLGAQDIITKADARAIVSGLKAILREVEADKFEFQAELEDVHMNVEAALTKRIGAVGGQIAYGPEPKRPGGHVAQAVAQKPGRRGARGAFGAEARLAGASGVTRRHRDARLHALTARAACFFGASFARIFPDVAARRRAFWRSARPGQCFTAGRGRACGRQPPDRQKKQ